MAARIRARAAVVARVRRVHHLSVRQELLARPLPDTTIPEPAPDVGRSVAVPRRVDIGTVHEQPPGDRGVRGDHRADGYRARPPPGRARASTAPGHHDLPDDLLVDRRHFGRGRVADLADAPEPANRAVELLARPHRKPVAPRRPEVGAHRRRGCDDLAEPRSVVHHHVGRPASGTGRVARSRACRRRRNAGRAFAT